MFGRFKKSIRNIASYVFVGENTKLLLGGLVLTVTGVGLDLLVPYVLGETIAMLASGTATTVVLGIEMGPYMMIATGASTYALRSAVVSYRGEVLAPIGPNAFAKAVCDYSDHAIQRSVEEKSEPGLDLTRIQKGVIAISSFSSQACSQFLPILSSTLSSAGMLSSRYGGEYGGLLVTAVGVCVAYNVATAKKIVTIRAEILETNNKSFDHLMFSVNHSATIQSFLKEDEVKKRSREVHGAAGRSELKSNRFMIQVARYQDFFLNMVLAGTCLLAGREVLSNKLGAGDFATIQALMIQCFANVSGLAQATGLMVSGARDSQIFFDYLETPSHIVDRFPNEKLQILPGNASIEFKNVCFTYKSKPNVQVLNNISCQIMPGQKIAFVGATGSGKSTATKLISRSIDQMAGTILIAGKDTQKVGLKSLRRNIGIIEQNPVILSGTLLENILYGVVEPEGSLKRQAVNNILEAARKDLEDSVEREKKKSQENLNGVAQLQPSQVVKKRIESFPENSLEQALIQEVFIAIDNAKLTDYVKKNGLLTPIEERGANLSGGQVQRVAIARVLMRGEYLKILLLDEATSALDAKTEKEIQANIDEISKKLGLTSVWVTHHRDNVRNADMIFVMNEGQIVQKGTDKQLMDDTAGVYAKLWADHNLDRGEDKPSQNESRVVNFARRDSGALRLFDHSTTNQSNRDNKNEVVIDIEEDKEPTWHFS